MIVSKLNMSIFKEVEDVMSTEEFLVKSAGKHVITKDGLSKYISDIDDLIVKGAESELTESELGSIEKADAAISSLERVKFLGEDGEVNEVFLLKAEEEDKESKEPKEGLDEGAIKKKKKEMKDEDDDKEDDDKEDEDDDKEDEEEEKDKK